MNRRIRNAIAVASLAFAASSIAAPFVYTLSGTASGSLNGVPFTNAAFSASGVSDSSSVTFISPNVYCSPLANFTFSIGGVGSGTVAEPMLVFSSTNAGGALGFERGTCTSPAADWIDVTHASFASYQLDTAAGPTTPTSTLVQGSSPFTPISTTAGALEVFNGSTTMATFQAAALGPGIVTNTLDSGAGSLRDAIDYVNTAGGGVTFLIPGAGPFTIQPLTPLPALAASSAYIDGYTQPGAARNTSGPGSNDAVLQIVLDGSLCGPTCDGITVTGSPTTVQGLAIHSFAKSGVKVQFGCCSFMQTSIYDNYIGTDAGGMTAKPNGEHGIDAAGAFSAASVFNNVISGNTLAGIHINAGGILLNSGNNQIGGKRDGSAGMGNGGPGIEFAGMFSTNRVNDSFIRYNGGAGIVSTGGTLRMSNNSIHHNGGPGITGALPAPTITSVTYVGSDTVVSGTVTAGALASVVVEIFHNTTLPSVPEGEQPVGTASDFATAGGVMSFTTTISGFLAQNVTAIAQVDTCGDACYTATNYSAPFVPGPTTRSITLTPSSLAFAARAIGTTSSPQTVTLQNNGPALLTISSIMASGDFAFTSACPPTLASGGTCGIDVTFTPLAPGARTGALTIASDATGSPHTVPLSGTGDARPIGILEAAPSPLQFDAQAVGTTSAPQLLTLHNAGNATLNRGPESVDGDFRLLTGEEADAATDGQACGAAIEAGDSCLLALVFAPTALGTREGAIALPNDGPSPVLTVRLVGSGATPSSPRVLAVQPGIVSFGDQRVGTQSAPHTVTLTNDSSSAAAITELSASPRDFIVSDGCATVPAGGSCAASIVFQPTAVGPRAGTLTIRTFSETDPYTVQLGGTGLFNGVPALGVSVTRIGFGNVLVGGSNVLGLTLTNIGLVPVVLGAMNALDGFTATSTCGSTLDVGAECGVQIVFRPRRTGVHATTLDIFSNAANSPHRVDLSGTGCSLPLPTRSRIRPVLCGP